MERRTFLQMCILGGSALSGCLSRDTNSSLDQDQDEETATSASNRKSKPQVNLQVIDREWPVPDGLISGEFDCAESTAIITGWTRPPSACYELTVDSLEYPEESDGVLITLDSIQSRDRDDTTCEGVAYKFRLSLQFKSELPKKVSLRYESPETGAEISSQIRNNSC